MPILLTLLVSLAKTLDSKVLKQSVFDIAMTKLSLEKAKDKFQEPVVRPLELIVLR